MDIYYTIDHTGSSKYTEKMSRFLGFALHVTNAAEAKAIIKKYQNDYHDARHVCWAYMLGPDRNLWQLNDNGEPSGTAGKPILGQINSFNLTDVLIIVVRYFGGIKLGTSGLISAYRTVAKEALEDAGRVEKRRMNRLSLSFEYQDADGVMKIVKHPEITVINRKFDMTCEMEIEFPQDLTDEVMQRLDKVTGLTIKDQ